MSQPTIALVIARYREPVDWILRLQENVAVVIYNKGLPLTDTSITERALDIIELPNSGKEAHSYLAHILSNRHREAEWTAFVQGDPFEHSPDLIALLGLSAHWRDVQCLSAQWKASEDIPPRCLLEFETRDWIEGQRARVELFSLHTWTPLQFFDPGAGILGQQYLDFHQLPKGWNIAGHFLELCGLPEMAERAHQAQVGRFAYGAQFGVKTAKLAALTPAQLEALALISRSHPLYPCILERLWLHLSASPSFPCRSGSRASSFLYVHPHLQGFPIPRQEGISANISS